MLNKEHSTLSGIQKIVNIKASINLGLSKDLKEFFIETVPVQDYVVDNIIYNNIAPDWVAVFYTGESNFFITVQKSKTKSGLAVSLRFSIAQHSIDFLLLESIVNLFGWGKVTKYKNRLVSEFIVTKIEDVLVHIIPSFEKDPVVGFKHLSFLHFKEASFIIKNKEHLNLDGGKSSGLKKVLDLKNKITRLYQNKL